MSRALRLTVFLTAAALAAPALPAAESAALTVRRAVALALERAPEIAVARASAQEADAAARIAASDRKPHFAVNTTPGYSTGLPLAVAGEVPAAAGARLGMTLYDPIARGEEFDAVARSAASAGALDETRAEVVRRTASACARLSTDEGRVAAARRSLEAREAMTRRERALEREGRRTALDVERVSLEEARARRSVYAAESDRDLDRLELARLIGAPAGSPISVVEEPGAAVPEPEAGDAAALAITRDRELRSLAEQAAALRRSADLLAPAFKPTVNAEARYAYVPRAFGYDKYYLNFQENVASLGVSVVLPLLTGGRETALAAQSRARLEQIEAQRHLRESELAREARQAEAELARADLDAALARRALGLNEEALGQAQALAREGRGEADGVELAALGLSKSEEDLAGAERDRIDARLRLLALRGELLSAFGLEAKPGVEAPAAN